MKNSDMIQKIEIARKLYKDLYELGDLEKEDYSKIIRFLIQKLNEIGSE